MPWEKFTKTKKGKKKWCVRNKESGQVRCSDSKEKRKKMLNVLRGTEHGWKPTK